MKVMHATEALAGGVLSSLQMLTAEQARTGFEVEILHLRRADTPPAPRLRELIHSDVRITEVPVGTQRRLAGLAALGRHIRTRRTADPDLTVHLHSSFAGGVGRLPFRRTGGSSDVTFYSPHGFAFLRKDIPRAVRGVYRLMEWALARRSVLVLVSPSEQSVAATHLRAPRTDVLPNAVDVSELPPRRESSRERPVVAMAGRVTFQKAPWRFAELAKRLDSMADFVWIGGGDATRVDEWLAHSPVRLTGWQERDVVLDTLRSADLFCFATLWEGMPMTLIEAQAIGLPCVASDVTGNRDVIDPGVTGYLVADDEALEGRVRELIGDAGLRRSMGDAAAERVRTEFASDRLGPDSLALYERWTSHSKGVVL